MVTPDFEQSDPANSVISPLETAASFNAALDCATQGKKISHYRY